VSYLRLTIASFLALAAVLTMPARATAGEPDFLALSLGYYDMFDDMQAAEGRVEYRFDSEHKLLFFTPHIGFMATSDGGTYGYGGIGVDIFLGRRVVMTPSFTVGIYGNGGGKDMGYPLEFKSGLEVAYRFDNYARLGLSFHHISNAGLDERNPGEETLAVTLAVPMNVLFKGR
jgi:lipid A 3-O-deacylase